MADVPKLQAGYVGRVDTLRTGFVGPPGPAGRFVVLTQAQYDALSPAAKADTSIAYLVSG